MRKMRKRTKEAIERGWEQQLSEMCDRLVIDALRNVHADGRDAVKTGIEGLDRITGGLLPGVHVLAGHPGIGKTALALQIAIAAARSGHGVLYATFEDSPERLRLRALACAYNQQRASHWANHVLPATYEQGRAGVESVAEALSEAFRDAKDFIVRMEFRAYSPMPKPAALVEKADILPDRSTLIIIDHLQSWSLHMWNNDDNAERRLMSDLARLARNLHIAILAISSGTYMYDVTPSATTVLVLEEARDSQVQPAHITEAECLLQEHGVPSRHLTLELAKNRYGDKGVVLLRHYPDRCFFEQIA
jgi:KaiC/GvpD/RAD55 family RecA-like ATPase